MELRAFWRKPVPPPLAESKAKLHGLWHAEQVRGGRVIWTDEFPNIIVDVGLNKLLDVHYRNQTQIASWYVGLVDASGFTAFANADTMGSHAGWTTEITAYDEATRVQWSPDAASGRAVTNSSVMVFTFNASKTVHGILVSSSSTKGGASGTLNSEAAFSGGDKSFVATDLLRLTYTISG